MQIAVVDYGMGNLRSVTKALEAAAPNCDILLTDQPQAIANADKIVFPGQGAMPDCMRELHQRNLIDSIKTAAAEKPFLGICIGLQLLFSHSEEGDADGLNLLSGQVVRFPSPNLDASGQKLKVPHMGWSEVRQHRTHPVFADIAQQERFYFVHSFYVKPDNNELILADTEYPFAFTCAISRANVIAVQFHPEKSSHAGLQLLRNFADWNGLA